jgi:hypothetical protein
LTEALRGRGGWLEVDPSLNIKVHGAEEAASAGRNEMTPTPFFDRMPEPQQSDVAR